MRQNELSVAWETNLHNLVQQSAEGMRVAPKAVSLLQIKDIESSYP